MLKIDAENGMHTDNIVFENLPRRIQMAIIDAMPKGLVEVHCPWWPEDHWEKKDKGLPFEECFYRIIEKTS